MADEISVLMKEYTTLKYLVDSHKQRAKTNASGRNNSYNFVNSTYPYSSRYRHESANFKQHKLLRSATEKLISKPTTNINNSWKPGTVLHPTQTSKSLIEANGPSTKSEITFSKRALQYKSFKMSPAIGIRKKILTKYKFVNNNDGKVLNINHEIKIDKEQPSKYSWTANHKTTEYKIETSSVINNTDNKYLFIRNKYRLSKLKVSPKAINRHKVKVAYKLKSPKYESTSPRKTKLSLWNSHKAKFYYRRTNVSSKTYCMKNQKAAPKLIDNSNKFGQHKMITVDGIKFVVNGNRRRLCKGGQNMKTYLENVKGSKTMQLLNVKPKNFDKVQFANRAIYRSIFRLNVAKQKSKKFCLFYNKFGKCNKNEKGTCPYIHDSDKIAICKRFLRGNCNIEKCPFSHARCRSKMPACNFFLHGSCHNGDLCNYSHVNVGRDADICVDFVNGYCAAGEKCKKWHLTHCNEFEQKGSCSRTKCPLVHRKKIVDQQSSHHNKTLNGKLSCAADSNFKKIIWEGPETPLPAFIPISDITEPASSVSGINNGSLQIRPNFLTGNRDKF